MVPTVVACEADQLDPDTRLGRSVLVNGYARPVTDPADMARLSAALTTWVDMPVDTHHRIDPEFITGYRLIPA